ncbi:MAG: hypothetical protein K1060chlam4_01371 [Candidatus Anoxychlamydiales bacterium]|nr:hypothetical protein [Candidatus Anoxychlamydiales bacterium]
MKIVDTAIIGVKDFYNKVEDLTKKRPISIIISTVALTILSAFVSPVSSILAIGVFSFALFLAVVIAKNFEKVWDGIEDQITEVFEGRAVASRAKGRREGNRLAKAAEKFAERAIGVAEGIVS